MITGYTHTRPTVLVATIVMLLTMSLPMAAGDDHSNRSGDDHSNRPGVDHSNGGRDDQRNRTIEVTFTKWVTTFPLMEGYWGDAVGNTFVGEILQRQVSQRQADNRFLPAPNCGRIIRLEALYEFHNGDRSFTALVRGGTSGDTGAALLDGTTLFGWRVGAPVHVEFQTIPGSTGCVGAPLGVTCFQGTVRIAPVPRD
jgi:hypothetical protein